MIELFQMGGLLFMSILTLQLVGVILVTSRYFLKDDKKPEDLNLIKSIGLFALVTGIFGQLLGLFDALKAIEIVGTVSPKILAAGLKVSMITTIYGVIIFLVSYIAWIWLKLRAS